MDFLSRILSYFMYPDIKSLHDDISALTDNQFAALRDMYLGDAQSLSGRAAAVDVSADLLERISSLTHDDILGVMQSEQQQRFDQTLQRYVEESPSEERDERQQVVEYIGSAIRDRGSISLHFYNLSHITALPDFSNGPELISLALIKCTSLSELSCLSNCPHLVKLFIADCTQLRDLSGLSNCTNLEDLYLTNCTSLSDLTGIGDYCPNLVILDLRGCTSLTARPAVRERCHVALPLHLQYADTVYFDLGETEIAQDPVTVLNNFTDFILCVQDRYLDEWCIRSGAAVDAGGVKRDVIFRLTWALLDHLEHAGEPPAVTPAASNSDSEERWRRLGILLSIPLRFEAPIGAMFDQACFNALSAGLINPAQHESSLLDLGLLLYPKQKQLLELLSQRGLAHLSPEQQEEVWPLLQDTPELEQHGRAFCYYHRSDDQQDAQIRAYLMCKEPSFETLYKLDAEQPVSFSLTMLERLTPLLEPTLVTALRELVHKQQTQEEIAIDEQIKAYEARAVETTDPARKSAYEAQIARLQNQRIDRDRTLRIVDSEGLELLSRIGPALRDSIPEREDFQLVIRTLMDQQAWNAKVFEICSACSKPTLLSAGRAISAICQGILGALPEDSDLQACTPEFLKEQLEGALSREMLLAALPPEPANAAARTTHQWLRLWVQQASDEQLSRFCQAVTGSGALSYDAEGQPLAWAITWQNGVDLDLPTSHTCSRELELPTGYKDYEVFQNKLETFIAYAQVGFGFI